MKKITVAIDGYSSTGKSTMARQLAASLGYRYIDSGAMYRAVALFALRNGIISDNNKVDVQEIIKLLPRIVIDFVITENGQQHTFINGEDVEEKIRDLRVSNIVSQVAAIPEVRFEMVRQQRELGAGGGIVMDGRDIGTTVFPEAELKIFVTASPEIRAARRFNELKLKDENIKLADVLENVKQRDYLDEHREVSPLRKSPDAILLDNGNMTLKQQQEWLYNLAILKIGK